MANYSIVANSVFKPFTYQELVAPVLHQQQVHDALADEYDKLSEKADLLEAMGHNEKDKNSPAYAQYKAYSDRLRAEADELYRNGLNSESRMRLSQLRKMYNTDIVPIQNAWTKREAEAQMQLKARLDAAAKGVDIRFSRDAANSTLQSYLENPNQTFKIINGNQIAAEVANQFKGLANQVQLDKNGTPWIGNKKLSRYEYAIITQNGMDYNTYMDFANHPNDPKFANIKGVIDNTLRAHSIGDFDGQTYKDMFNYGIQGVSAGVGARAFQFHTDQYAMKQDEFAQAKALKEIDHQNKLKEIAAANGGGGETITPYDTSVYQLPIGGADFSKSGEQRKAMETLGYVEKNGKLVPTGKVKIKYSLDKDEVSKYNAEQRKKMNELGRKVHKGTATEAEANEYATMQRMLGRYGNFKSPVLSSTTKEFSVFNKDGKIMTRKEFVAQAGNSKNARKALNDYFDKMVGASKTMGLYGDSGNIYTQNELSKQYNTLRSMGAASYANVYNLNINKNAWNPTATTYKAQEVKSVKGGKAEFDSKSVSLGDILNSSKNDVASAWGRINGKDGLILYTTVDGKSRVYFIDADTMPESNIQNRDTRNPLGARYWFDAADYARENGYDEEAGVATGLGLSSLMTGLTLTEKGQDQQMNRQLTKKEGNLSD